jgi:hypothetical protein
MSDMAVRTLLIYSNIEFPDIDGASGKILYLPSKYSMRQGDFIVIAMP